MAELNPKMNTHIQQNETQVSFTLFTEISSLLTQENHNHYNILWAYTIRPKYGL